MIRFMGNGLALVIAGAIGLLNLSEGDRQHSIAAPTELAPPTNLRAASGNARVFLSWTASPDSGSSEFLGYQIVTATSSRVVVDSAQIASTAISYAIFGLVNGGVYTFTVQSMKSNGSVSQKVTIQGEPMLRYKPQCLHEHESPMPPGLTFLAGQRITFTVGSKAIRVFQQRWQHTLFVETVASSLDEFVVAPDISAFRSTPGMSIVPGKVYFVLTPDSNYTKFRVEPPGVQVDPANNRRFVNVTVAHSSSTGNWAEPRTLSRER